MVKIAPKSPRNAMGGINALLSDRPPDDIMADLKFANSLRLARPALDSMASSKVVEEPVVRRKEDRGSDVG